MFWVITYFVIKSKQSDTPVLTWDLLCVWRERGRESRVTGRRENQSSGTIAKIRGNISSKQQYSVVPFHIGGGFKLRFFLTGKPCRAWVGARVMVYVCMGGDGGALIQTNNSNGRPDQPNFGVLISITIRCSHLIRQ